MSKELTLLMVIFIGISAIGVLNMQLWWLTTDLGAVLLFVYGSIMVRHISVNVMLLTDSPCSWCLKRTSERNTVYNRFIIKVFPEGPRIIQIDSNK